MPEYKVRVERIETRTTEITVTAMSASDAKHMALDQAGDIDFRDCKFSGAEYEADVEGEEEVSDCCGCPISEENTLEICSSCGRECEPVYKSEYDEEE